MSNLSRVAYESDPLSPAYSSVSFLSWDDGRVDSQAEWVCGGLRENFHSETSVSIIIINRTSQSP